MNDPWHDLPHSERRRIAHNLGLSADNHFRAACGYYGVTYRDLQHFPVLVLDLYRAERALRSLAVAPRAAQDAFLGGKTSPPPPIAK